MHSGGAKNKYWFSSDLGRKKKGIGENAGFVNETLPIPERESEL
jgi:hypothetical protein